MTEKRFSVALRKHTTQYELVDNWKTGDYPFIEPFYYKKTANDLANFLNQLQEENEQLKSKISEQGVQLDFLKAENKHMKSVLRKNRELEERNNKQYERLSQLYDLIEKQDWESLTGIIQELEEAEEQLQKEWGNYGDVE